MAELGYKGSGKSVASIDFSGYGAKALGTGVQQGFSMGMQAKEWKWKKDQQKKIDDAKEKAALEFGQMGEKFHQAYANGFMSQEEWIDISQFATSLGSEAYDMFIKMDKGIKAHDASTIDAEVEELEALIELCKATDTWDLAAFDNITKNYQGKKAVAQRDFLRQTIQARDLAGTDESKVEKYATLEEFQDKYDEDTPYEYDDEGYLRPKYVAPKDPKALSDYQRKRQNIMDNKNISEAQRKIGIFKLDSGIDLTKNDDEGDFTTTEGKRTADFAFTQLFGYTTPDGIKIAGIVPANLARVLSLGRKATEAEVEQIMFDWKSRKNVVRKMGGLMAVEAIDTILDQLLRETKPEDVVEDTLLDKAKKYIEENYGGTDIPEGVEPPKTETIETPKVDYGGKSAQIPLMSKAELKAAMEKTDPSDPIYKEMYDRAVKEGWI